MKIFNCIKCGKKNKKKQKQKSGVQIIKNDSVYSEASPPYEPPPEDEEMQNSLKYTPSVLSNPCTDLQSEVSLASTTETFFTTQSSAPTNNNNNNNSNNNNSSSINNHISSNNHFYSCESLRNKKSLKRLSNHNSSSEFMSVASHSSFPNIQSQVNEAFNPQKKKNSGLVSNRFSQLSNSVIINGSRTYDIPTVTVEPLNPQATAKDTATTKAKAKEEVQPATLVASPSKQSSLSENELQALARQVLNPDLTDYTLYSVIKNRIKVYTKLRKSTGINEYLIVGCLNNANLREAYEVYMDLEYRKEWDELNQQINIMEKKENSGKKKGSKSNHSSSSFGNNDFEIHWQVKLPWPLSNREYVFERNTYETRYDDKIFLIAKAKSVNPEDDNNTNKDENSKSIRITEYEQTTVFYSDKEDGKCYVYMEYYDDPKGNIPVLLKNWVLAKAAPNFITNIEKACKEYKNFEKRLKNNRHIKELNVILEESMMHAFDDLEIIY